MVKTPSGRAGREASPTRASRRKATLASRPKRVQRAAAPRFLVYTPKFRVVRLTRLLGSGRASGLTAAPQQQTLWCWAAVADSISHFYDPGSAWTQCTIANAELAQTTCCANGATAVCNKAWYLHNALTRVGCLQSMTSGTLTFAAVRSLINADTPPCARQGWNGGGGHFVAIVGYLQGSIGVLVGGRSTTKRLRISDPWYGDSVVDYDDFVAGYQGRGTWTHAYRTAA